MLLSLINGLLALCRLLLCLKIIKSLWWWVVGRGAYHHNVLQVISNVIDHGMNISQAVGAARFHMQWLPDEIRTEPFGMVKDVEENLEKMGYKVVVKPRWEM